MREGAESTVNALQYAPCVGNRARCSLHVMFGTSDMKLALCILKWLSQVKMASYNLVRGSICSLTDVSVGPVGADFK